MKKNKLLIIGAFTLLVAGTISASISLAWFHPTTKIGNEGETNTMPIDGSSSSGYFAYGDGSAEHPFGIRIPRHLYNLAWLQYINHFGNKQLYFELANNVNMSGWTLPPIGTEDNPFIGHFDGQGYSVSNLTVSNNFTDYNVHPSIVDGFNTTTYKQPHILGMFGVVGNYKNLPALPETPQEGVDYYSSAVNTFVDTGIVNITITSKVANSLVGLAAGYAGSTMSKIAVESGTIDINKTAIGSTATSSYGSFTSNISDYTLVGYTPNKKTVKKVSNTIYSVDVQTQQEFIANTQGGTTGWGGSINMNAVFDRLTTMRSATETDYDFSIHYKHLDDSNLSNPYETVVTGKQTIRRYIGNTGTNTEGVVNFVRDGTSWSSTKHYLVGGKYITRDVYTSNDASNGYQITDGSHYLSFNGTALSNSNSAYSSGWQFETVNGNGYIRTNYNGTLYYLRNNNGTLTTTTTQAQATSWTISFNNTSLCISSTSGGVARNLYYDSSWGLFYGPQLANRNGTRYVPSSLRNGVTNNNGLASVNSPQVSFGPLSIGDQVRFTYDGTTYYLCVYVSNDSRTYYVAARTTPGDATNYHPLCYFSTGGYAYIRTAGTYRISNQDNRYAFLIINNNNNWLMTNHGSTTNNDSRLSFSLQGVLSNTLTTKSSTSSSEKLEFTSDDTTYFPVMANSDGSVDKDNVGYFVAGSTNSTFERGGTSPRSIIVSSYPKTSKLKGYDNTTHKFDDAQIYTINASGPAPLNTSDTEKYAKYASSKKNLEGNLEKPDNVGGFHFYARNSALGKISKDSTVMAKNVLISDGDKDTNDFKTTFELPVYSLDFHLVEQGRINFFAGMYNGGGSYGSTVDTDGTKHMNGFFSFHRVFRNASDEITSIKEIRCIYEKEGVKDYYYVYKNGSNLVDGSNNTISDLDAYVTANGLTLLFDTNWLAYRELHTDAGRVYYFEIPADEGEYCLGSYETPEGEIMDGAYLIYLDIGAGAAKMKRTAVAEHFSEVSVTTSYPLGVALISSDTASPESNAFDASNSVCIIIEATYKGELSVSRDASNNVTVTRDADYTEVARPSYVSDTIVSVVDPGASSDTTDDIVFDSDDIYESKVETETYRIQYFDYNVTRESLYTTIITDVTTCTNEGSWTTPVRHVFQFEDDDDPVELVNQTQIDKGEILVFQYLGINGGSNGISWTYDEVMSQSTTLWYYATTSGTGSDVVITDHLLTLASICSSLDSMYIELSHETEINAANPSSSPDVSEFNVALNMVVDTSISNETATYYMFSNYRITPVVVNGSVTYIVEDLKTGAVVYIGTSTTAVTNGSEITINP